MLTEPSNEVRLDLTGKITLDMLAAEVIQAIILGGPSIPGMSLIPAGPFEMGDPYNEGGSDELPVHSVYVSGFYLDKYEVSNEQMRQVLQWAYDTNLVIATATTVQNSEGNPQELLELDSVGSEISFAGGVFTVDVGRENFPCQEVSWYGSQAYCNYKSDIEGLNRCIDFTDWSCDF